MKQLNRLLIQCMKISLVQVALACVFIGVSWAETLSAQELLQQRLSINVSRQKMKTVLSEIERQTTVRFSYSPQVIRSGQPVTLNLTDRPLNEVLERLLTPLQIRYELSGKQVILSRQPEEAFPPGEESMIALPPAQTVSGKVTDEKGGELPGVSILVKGTQRGTTTSDKGLFSIEVPDEKAVLVFSFVGYVTEEITVGSRNSINVALRVDEKSLEEVVVVAYGTQKKTSVTAAVVSLKGDEVARVPTANLSNNFGGRLSGVIVKQGSGEPGRDGSNIFIRGISTTGSNEPLLIVDGIPRSFQQLDPNSIESFTVLKDAAAVAPYGVAGANGVVLVTTKKGQTGKPTITYNGYVGFQNPTVLPEYVNSVEYATLKNEIARTQGLPLPYNDDALRKFADGSDPDIYPTQNILDYVISKNSPMTYHNLEMTGGTDKMKYYAGFGYLYQRGMWNTTYSNRYNINLNIEGKVSKYTTVSLGMNGRITSRHYPNSDQPSSATTRIIELMGYAQPERGPVVFSNGMYGSSVMPAIFESGYLKDRNNGIFTQLNVNQEIPFVRGLSLKGTVAYDPTFTSTKGWSIPMSIGKINTSVTPYEITLSGFGTTKPNLYHNADQSEQFIYQAGFDYIKSFKNHNLSVLGLFEAKAYDYWSVGVSRRNYDLFIDEINMGSSTATDMTTAGTSRKSRQVGLVYRVAYDYAGKYLLEASGRYDGHYYFAPSDRFGFFPAVSAGWRISEENFLKNNAMWLDNLKIRASYGEVGALAGSAFQYLSTYNVSGPGYVINRNAVPIVTERSEPNLSITWERARKTDIGLEATLFKNLINLEIDYFYEKRSNMLVNPDVVTPLEYGIGLSQVNKGIMENRGIDLSAGFNYRPAKDFLVQLNGTFTFAKNRLLQTFENTVTYNNPNRRRTGRPLNTQFGYNAIGYFQPEDFDDKGALREGIPAQPWGAVAPGDLRYEDANGDGKIDVNDEVAIGDANQSPRIIYGFSPRLQYKNWSLDMLFQGSAKTHLYHRSEMAWAFYNGQNAYKENLDYWTPENRNAAHPRLTAAPNTNNTQLSSHWMRNAAYLRAKNVTLSYRIPDAIAEKAGMHNVRVYASAQNILTWSKLLNWDPESTHRSYPQQKVISVGINLSL